VYESFANVEQLAFGGSGMTGLSSDSRLYDALWDDADKLEKALTTGEGIVTAGTTGGAALREQWLHGQLELVSFEQDDAELMRRIPKKTVKNVALEWSLQTQYGGPGDGSVAETGTDGAFGVSASDDNYQRRVRKIKYMASQRIISIASKYVQNVEDPETAAERGGTLEIIGKANLQCYFGDSLTAAPQMDGIVRQIKDWVTDYPQDAEIMVDCGGVVIDKVVLETGSIIGKSHYARPKLLIQSSIAYGDTQISLFPSARYGEGDEGVFGVDKRKFRSPIGAIELMDDAMLRPNQPLVVDGVGVDGKPRTATPDTGSLPWVATPWTTCAGTTAGTGNYWETATINTSAAAVTKPAVPTPLGNNNASNRLAVNTYYYAVSIVYQGKESLAWVYGAAAVDSVTSATGVSVTSTNKLVSMSFDYTQITGLGSTYPRNQVKLRVYRCDTTAPVTMKDFNFLVEVGFHTATANPTAYDNGFLMPGLDNAFQITEKKNGQDGWFLAQLLPMLRRDLPHLAMADQFVILAFLAPILWVPRHHIWYRNVGRS